MIRIIMASMYIAYAAIIVAVASSRGERVSDVAVWGALICATLWLSNGGD